MTCTICIPHNMDDVVESRRQTTRLGKGLDCIFYVNKGAEVGYLITKGVIQGSTEEVANYKILHGFIFLLMKINNKQYRVKEDILMKGKLGGNFSPQNLGENCLVCCQNI